jgi:uncharacterized protein
MAQRKISELQAVCYGLFAFMQKLLTALSIIGTAAILCVGRQIIVYGLGIHLEEGFGLYAGLLTWLADATISGLIGLAIVAVIVGVHHMWVARKRA